MEQIDITGQNFLISSAISHIASQNPMNRLPIRGGAMALKSAQMQGMRREVDPSKMIDKQKVIWEKLSNRTIMKVKFGWKPMNQKTATTVRTSIVGVTGASPVQGVESTLAYDMYHQSEAIEQSPIDQIQSSLLNDYYKKWAGGAMTLPQLLAAVQETSFGNVATTIWESAMNGLFPAQANALMAKLFLGVGTNPHSLVWTQHL